MFKSLSIAAYYSIARLLFFWRRSRQAIILMYHSVGHNGAFHTVRPSMFVRQMRWLKENGYKVVSLDELAAHWTAGAIPPKTIALTFDDGYRDNYEIAFPILMRYGFPATIFVTTGDLGTGGALPKLSKDEIGTLAASGLVTVEPHSVSHRKLTELTSDEVERETRESKDYLESVIGRPCVHFAYPRGRYDASTCGAVKRAGIRYAYTTDAGAVTPESDPYRLARNEIRSTTSLAEFKGIVTFGRKRFRA